MSSLLAIAAVTAFVLWREINWRSPDTQFVVAGVFALLTIILMKIPVELLDKWLS